jgi:hypothetical protein
LNTPDPVAALTAVRDQVGLHMTVLALDVVGWLALAAAGLVVAGGHGGLRGHPAVPAKGCWRPPAWRAVARRGQPGRDAVGR